MSAVPQHNARVFAILGPGHQREYGKPPTEGTAKWTGEVSAYFKESLVTRISNGALDRAKRTTLVIPGDLRPAVAIRPGDKVDVEYAGNRSHVEILAATAAIGPPGTRRTVRLELQTVTSV